MDDHYIDKMAKEYQLEIRKLKEELYSTYEHAVRFVVGRLERKPRNWRRTYGLRT